MQLKRLPKPELRPFVKLLWSSHSPPVGREHILPTASMHIAFRLSGPEVRLFEGPLQPAYGFSIAAGARAAYYVKDSAAPARSVGAVLEPGAALPLLGAPAGEFAGRHFRLDDLWGAAAASARERLMEEPDPARRLDVLEEVLLARLPRVRALHPAVAMALDRFSENGDVGEVVTRSGYSHRRFIALFRDAVGLPPKLYCRVRRFQRALKRIALNASSCCVDVAIEAGYSDQAHFNREFIEFTGVTPGEYRRILPPRPHHVPVGRKPAPPT